MNLIRKRLWFKIFFKNGSEGLYREKIPFCDRGSEALEGLGKGASPVGESRKTKSDNLRKRSEKV